MDEVLEVEVRWKLGRANKGSLSIPKKLQFRVQKRVQKIENENAYLWPVWGEWRDVPTAK